MSYKKIYAQLHGIVKKQYRLSVQEQKALLAELDKVAQKAYESYPGRVTEQDKVVGVAAQKDFSAATKPAVADSKEKDKQRGYRWVGGNRVKVKPDTQVIDTATEDQGGVDPTIKSQISNAQ